MQLSRLALNSALNYEANCANTLQRWRKVELGLKCTASVACIASIIYFKIAPVALALLAAYYVSTLFRSKAERNYQRAQDQTVESMRYSVDAKCTEIRLETMRLVPEMEVEAELAAEGQHNPSLSGSREKVKATLKKAQSLAQEAIKPLEGPYNAGQLPKLKALVEFLQSDHGPHVDMTQAFAPLFAEAKQESNYGDSEAMNHRRNYRRVVCTLNSMENILEVTASLHRSLSAI